MKTARVVFFVVLRSMFAIERLPDSTHKTTKPTRIRMYTAWSGPKIEPTAFAIHFIGIVKVMGSIPNGRGKGKRAWWGQGERVGRGGGKGRGCTYPGGAGGGGGVGQDVFHGLLQATRVQQRLPRMSGGETHIHQL